MTEESLTEVSPELEKGLDEVSPELDVEIPSDEPLEGDSEEQVQTKSQNAKQRLRRKLQEEQDFNRKILADNQSIHAENQAYETKFAELEKKLKHVIDPDPVRPSRLDFETEESYEDSLYAYRKTTDSRSAPKEVPVTKEPIESEVPPEWKKQLKIGEDKYDDFQKVITSQGVRITDSMAMTIAESEGGAEIAYFLGKNVKESERIANLSLPNQVKEILKLELRFQKQTTNAPAPITPHKGNDTGRVDESKMTYEQYRDHVQKGLASKY